MYTYTASDAQNFSSDKILSNLIWRQENGLYLLSWNKGVPLPIMKQSRGVLAPVAHLFLCQHIVTSSSGDQINQFKCIFTPSGLSCVCYIITMFRTINFHMKLFKYRIWSLWNYNSYSRSWGIFQIRWN